MPIVAQDVGGEHPRKVIFFPKEGLVRVRLLTRGRAEDPSAQERAYLRELQNRPVGGDVEIF